MHPLSLQIVLLMAQAQTTWVGKTKTKQPWRETPAELGKRLAGIVADINTKLDVHGLCMEFPDRLGDAEEAKG